MGCGPSNGSGGGASGSGRTIPGKGANKSRNSFTQMLEMGVSEINMKRAYSAFKKMDTNGDGRIDVPELFAALGIASSNPFRGRLFRIFDLNGDGELGFREFILALGSFQDSSKTNLMRFAYRLFDEDGSSTLTRNEFVQVCRLNLEP
jgi:Ca2+-binding EF-hand superfamily protein